MTLPIHLIAPVPGAEDRAVKWESICREKHRGILICHEELRNVGRWGAARRARPFVVYWDSPLYGPLSSYKTLEAAEKAAAKWAVKLA